MYQNLPARELKLENELTSSKSSKEYLEGKEANDTISN